MSMTIAMLNTLVASGASAETIAAMWRVEIAERDARRVKDACRKREERAAEKVVVASTDGQGQTRTAADIADSDGRPSSRACDEIINNITLPSGENIIIPPLSPKPTRKTREDRGTRLPEDWKPTDDDLLFCASIGLLPDEMRTMTDEFRDYWHSLPGARGRKLDWSKTYRNRARDVAARKTRYAPKGSSPIVQKIEPDRTGLEWVPAGSPQWKAWASAKGAGFLAARKKDRAGYPDGGAWLPTEYPDARKSA